MRDELIEILDKQALTAQRAAIELSGVMGRSVTVSEAGEALESMVGDGFAKSVSGKKGSTVYMETGGGYLPRTQDDMMKSQKMRDSAREEPCTVNLVGVCNYDTATTVLAHLPDETNGMGKKADDLSACYACGNCHDCIDNRAPWPDSETDAREWYYRRAQTRTWRRMVDKGVITIKGASNG